MTLPNVSENLLTAALECANHGWPVLPLNGKVPAMRRRHPTTIAYATTSCVESFMTIFNPLRECRGGCAHRLVGIGPARFVIGIRALYDIDDLDDWLAAQKAAAVRGDVR